MVLYVMKWDIDPQKTEDYSKWTASAIKRTTGAPGVVEFRAYRMAAGDHQVIITYEFADMAAWAAWNMTDDVQQVFVEVRTLANNVTTELWGPSPVVPVPIRPNR